MEIKKFVFGNLRTNCYVILGDNEALFVDPGECNDELVELVKGYKNVKVLLTHRHFDHILGVARLKRETGAKVYISSADRPGLLSAEDSLASLMELEQLSVEPDELVDDGDIIKFDGQEIKVIATPGHTVGSVCYLMGNRLWSGDTLFKNSAGRTDLPSGDGSALIRSLKKLALLSDSVEVYPGHGDNTNMGAEKKGNPFIAGFWDYEG